MGVGCRLFLSGHVCGFAFAAALAGGFGGCFAVVCCVLPFVRLRHFRKSIKTAGRIFSLVSLAFGKEIKRLMGKDGVCDEGCRTAISALCERNPSFCF